MAVSKVTSPCLGAQLQPEQEEVELEFQDAEDVIMPHMTEHPLQQMHYIASDEEWVTNLGANAKDLVTAYAVQVCMHCNNMGVDVWKTKFPHARDYDFVWNIKDLAAYWGSTKADFKQGTERHINSRYTQIARQFHPDKHRDAPERAATQLEGLFKVAQMPG